MRKKSTRRTIWQMMNNEASGVPLVENAANLEHFFSKRGMRGTWLNDERGDIALPYGNTNGETNLFTTDGQYMQIESPVYTSLPDITGAWTEFGATDDLLILVVGRETDYIDIGTSFRIGSGAGATGVFQTPLGRPVTPNVFSDNHTDNAGVNISTSGADSRPSFGTSAGAAISVIDRTNGFLESRSWDLTNNTELVQGTPQDALGAFGAVTISTEADVATSPTSFAGDFVGVGVWKFPGGTLPADWYTASVTMGLAWLNGNYTFWPGWGKS